MATARIVYCSMTGNTEECAEIVYDKLKELGIDVQIDDCTTVDPDIYLDTDLAILGTYTYGEGDMPDEIIDFYDALMQMDLTGKLYGCFGSGDTFYEKFCSNVDDFDNAFASLGGVKAAESVKVDLAPQPDDEVNLEKFAETLAAKVQ